MEWRGVLFSLCFIVTLVESSGISGAMWLVSLDGEQTILYSWTICSASIFVLVALVLSMYLVFEHLAAYNQPEEQKFMIGLILMVPVYALESFLSLLDSNAAFNCEILRDCYEAFALYCFERYLIACLGGEERTIKFLESQSLISSSIPLLEESYAYGIVEHPFPLNCLLRDWHLGPDFYQAVKIGIVQYMILKLICALVAMVSQLFGVYGEGKFEWGYAYPYLAVVLNFSQSWALYCLVQFYSVIKDKLAPIKPLAKFLTFKSIVFLTWWQGVAVAFLFSMGAFKGSLAQELKSRIQDYVICIEMGVAAVVHLYVFPAIPYKRGERCVRNAAVMSDYASLGTDPDPEEVRDCESRESSDDCNANDEFDVVGAVTFDGAKRDSFTASRLDCERKCLSNCSCIGLHHNVKSNLCKNIYGSMLNIRNLSSDSTNYEALYVRVQRGGGMGKKNKKKSFVLIGVICGMIAVLILLVVSLLILRKKVIRRRKEEEETVYAVRNLKVFSYKELHAATSGFSEKLGHGGFGAVFRGQLSDSSSPVAVKRLERPGSGEKEFRAEVCTIGNIQHVNLVRLRGFCSEKSHRLLVYDYMPNGPLSVYLKKDGQNLSWDARFRVAMGTARGIAYLHEECRNCIIHCDIKPENILLDEDFSAKVSDFGLAKLIGRDFSRVLATMRGTWGYVAPEWISGVAITTKADVYSYGMTLIELIGGRRNVEGPPSAGGGGGTGEKWFFPPWAARHIIEGNVAAVVDERLGGLYNEAEAERLGLVAIWCIQDEEALRPTMGMVVKMLEGVVEVTVPPPPKLLQALVSGESFPGVRADSSDRISHGHSDGDAQLSGASKDSIPSP